ncbi:hypothetical protein AGMMS49545_23770 [Betaproteobacteria bacterium]|nr:hypothetical protein AGMMS49545_23770 [Betaproteobacteria bacterium]GHU49191.1 hypothetical protein AGMMS50289_26230 [Betaproteobacteria bacterium]
MKNKIITGILVGFAFFSLHAEPIISDAVNVQEHSWKSNDIPLVVHKGDQYFLYVNADEYMNLYPTFGIVTLNGGYRCCFSLSKNKVIFDHENSEKYGVIIDDKMIRYTLNYTRKIESGKLYDPHAEIGFAIPEKPEKPKIKIIRTFIDSMGETDRMTFQIGKYFYWVNSCRAGNPDKNDVYSFFLFKQEGYEVNEHEDVIWSTSYQYLTSSGIDVNYCPNY